MQFVYLRFYLLFIVLKQGFMVCPKSLHVALIVQLWFPSLMHSLYKYLLLGQVLYTCVMKNAHRRDSGQCCVCACTVDNLLTHKAEHALKTCSDTKLRLFWFQHDQILTGHARKTDTVLTALFHLLAVPCSNEVHPYRKSVEMTKRQWLESQHVAVMEL